MPLIQLPSFNDIKDTKELIDVLEKQRKELEYVLGNLDITNLNSNYVSVVETGSNANGTYLKYSDGTMECWHQGFGNSNYYTWWEAVRAGGTYYYVVDNWVFPAPFREGEFVKLFASGDIGGAAPETHTAFNVDHTKCQVENGMFGMDPAE